MILTADDGTYGFKCDRCGALATAEGQVLRFATAAELAVVAVRDGWLDENDDPGEDFVICPPCREKLLAGADTWETLGPDR